MKIFKKKSNTHNKFVRPARTGLVTIVNSPTMTLKL